MRPGRTNRPASSCGSAAIPAGECTLLLCAAVLGASVSIAAAPAEMRFGGRIVVVAGGGASSRGRQRARRHGRAAATRVGQGVERNRLRGVAGRAAQTLLPQSGVAAGLRPAQVALSLPKGGKVHGRWYLRRWGAEDWIRLLKQSLGLEKFVARSSNPRRRLALAAELALTFAIEMNDLGRKWVEELKCHAESFGEELKSELSRLRRGIKNVAQWAQRESLKKGAA